MLIPESLKTLTFPDRSGLSEICRGGKTGGVTGLKWPGILRVKLSR